MPAVAHGDGEVAAEAVTSLARRTGDPLNMRSNSASSMAASQSRAGLTSSLRGGEFRVGGDGGARGSRGRHPGRCRSRRPGGRCRAQVFGDGAALLDGQVGDAAVWRPSGGAPVRACGGAGIDAAGAGAAAVGCEGEGLIGSGVERRDDDGEKQPRAEILVHDAGVFAGPADAGVASIDALDDGAGVDVAAGLEGADLLGEAVAEFFEATQQDLVVIRGACGSVVDAGGPGVAGDPASCPGRGIGRAAGRRSCSWRRRRSPTLPMAEPGAETNVQAGQLRRAASGSPSRRLGLLRPSRQSGGARPDLRGILARGQGRRRRR